MDEKNNSIVKITDDKVRDLLFAELEKKIQNIEQIENKEIDDYLDMMVEKHGFNKFDTAAIFTDKYFILLENDKEKSKRKVIGFAPDYDAILFSKTVIEEYKKELEKTKMEEEEPVENEIKEIMLGKNELTALDLTACTKINRLFVSDNPYLNEIKGLNLVSIKSINLSNTNVSLAEDLEKIKQENQNLWKTIQEAHQAELEGKLTLAKPIRTKNQAKEAIKQLLQRTAKRWRDYFENQEESKEKDLLLELDFQFPEERKKGKEILGWIFEAIANGNYQQLLREWNGGEKWEKQKDKECCNDKHDYDGSLNDLCELVKALEAFQQTRTNYA